MASPFISPQDLVDHIGRGTATDPGFLIATDAACDIVRDIAEQTFNAVVADTITMDGTGTDALLLPERPVTAAGTVTVHGTAVTDYVLNGNGILFRRGTITSSWCWPGLTWPYGRQNITVTYNHGYADANIPRSVRVVALAIAGRIAVQGAALKESMGDVSMEYAAASTDLLPGELMILRKYKQTR
jgi:hypothetical protein